ncbi:MAG: UDP-forming cellulose synthase catalytic subunit [Nitrospirae bacterium]|nr:UDP-forming cellulose synthase catalytic subunit [Nitrospirota bacterium]
MTSAQIENTVRLPYSWLKNKIGPSLKSNDRLAKLILYASVSILIYYFLYLTEFYLSLTRQFIIGWGIVLTLIILNKVDQFKKPPLRLVFVLLAVFINVRYMIWRSLETLVYESPLDFIGMILIYAAELYALTIHLLGIFVNIWPQETKIMPLPEDVSLYPSVDIFIPTYNEPLDMVRITSIAALKIDYPKNKLNIHILDDGSTVAKRNDPVSAPAAWERYYALRRIAKEIGVNYITRETNFKAKAGNLNHAFMHTTADLILVLDCDHVPAKDILKNTAGWFLKDEKLAFIQTPHFFINPNPVEKNLGVFRDAPADSDLFFRASHLGLDFWNSSFFCGSAALLKRKCLEEVGVFSGDTITEDCETAFSLHSKGYNSLFISRPMVCGLSTETFDDFILQRSRWAQGMTQILVLNNPLFAKGLKLYQRLCYFNNCFYWFFGISRFIFYVAPAAFLLLGLHVFYASVAQVMVYAVPHLLSSIILMNFFYGKHRWPFLSDLFESIQSLFLLPVVFSVLANPRKPSFKVTPKGKSLDNDFISGLALPFFLMCLLMFIALPAAVFNWLKYPLYRDVIMITLAWCLFNFGLAMAGFGTFFEKRQIRRHHRLWAKGKLAVFFPRLKKTVEANFLDISLSGVGLSFKLPVPLKPQEHVILETRDSHGEKYKLDARIQRAVKKDEMYICGSEFIVSDETQFSKSIQFVYSDSQRWVDYWGRTTKTANPFLVLWFLMKMTISGVKGSVLVLSQLLYGPIANKIRLALRRSGIQPSEV